MVRPSRPDQATFRRLWRMLFRLTEGLPYRDIKAFPTAMGVALGHKKRPEILPFSGGGA